MKRLSLPCFLIIFLFCFTANAQISSFPYVQDFENFSNLSTTPSCTKTESGISAYGWYQDSTDDGDWRADSAGTSSLLTGPGATDSTTGEGIGTDANPGTTSGIYMYIESSNGATPCVNSTYSLLSPYFDLSSTTMDFRLIFSSHMLGSTIGSLHVDVYDNGVWTEDIWSFEGSRSAAWITDTLRLNGFTSDSVQIRFRAITGAGNYSDIALDNVHVETYVIPRFDLDNSSISYSKSKYTKTPWSQFDSIQFKVELTNYGSQQVTGSKIEATEGSYSSSQTIGNINSFSSTTTTLPNRYRPSKKGEVFVNFKGTINENDSFNYNNDLNISFNTTDSVYARDNDVRFSGVGVGTTNRAEIGQLFDIIETDTATSASVYIWSGVAGDSGVFRLYEYTQGVGVGNLLATSKKFYFNKGQGWYTARFECEEILNPGQYLLTAEQLSFDTDFRSGFNNTYFTPITTFFRVFFNAGGASAWDTIESAPSELFGTVSVRLNLGKSIFPKIAIIADKDTACEQEQIYLQAQGGTSYKWSPANLFFAPTLANSLAVLDTTRTISVVGTNQCGISSKATYDLVVIPGPHAGISPDTTACSGDIISLRAKGGNTYKWINGPTTKNYNITVGTDNKTYVVIIDSSNGCSRSVSTNITSSSTEVKAPKDTSLCEYEALTLIASGSQNHYWDGNSASDTLTLIANSSGYHIVEGRNSIGCSDLDSVYVTVLDAPELVVTQDTGGCFRDSIYLMASGADSYQWENGPGKAVYPVRILGAKTYKVSAVNNSGCKEDGQVFVDVYFKPELTISNDTTICEGESVDITAGGGDLYTWNTGATTSTITVAPKTGTTYSVEVKNTEGCFSEDSLKVNVNPLPIASFSVVVIDDSAQMFDISSFADDIEWDFGDGNNSTENDPYHLYTADGNYNITLTANNACGTDDTTISISITIPVKSVHDHLLNSSIETYPNPTNAIVNFKIDNPIMGLLSVNMIDLNGKLIWTEEFLKNAQVFESSINMRELSKGVYYLNFEINGLNSSRMIIKN